MILEEVLNELNLTLTKDNRRLILQRSIDVNPSFKVIKTFKAVLWFIGNGKKESVLTYTITDRVTDDLKDKVWEKVDTHLIIELINNYNNIIGRNEVSQT